MGTETQNICIYLALGLAAVAAIASTPRAADPMASADAATFPAAAAYFPESAAFEAAAGRPPEAAAEH